MIQKVHHGNGGPVVDSKKVGQLYDYDNVLIKVPFKIERKVSLQEATFICREACRPRRRDRQDRIEESKSSAGPVIFYPKIPPRNFFNFWVAFVDK